MGHKTPNKEIGCKVRSCAFHCDQEEYCSLHNIMVEPCPGCGNGSAKDETLCASYKGK